MLIKAILRSKHMTLANEKVKKVKKLAFINLPGRRWASQVIQGFQSCEGGKGSGAYDENTGEVVFFYQDPATKLGLAVGYEICEGKAAGLRYAFMTSDGSIMPDAGYCGIISGKEQTLERCRELLIRGMASFTPQ